MDLSPGARVGEHIVLERTFHRGNRSSLWLARDHGRGVVVKFIQPELVGSDEHSLARFEREGDIGESIDSEHAVPTRHRGVTDEGRPYLVMDRLEGTSLAARGAARFAYNQSLRMVIDKLEAKNEAPRFGARR